MLQRIKSMSIESKYLLLYASIAFIMYGIAIQFLYGPVRFPDEFGYLAHAAQWCGYDWDMVSAMHPYYSFGYSVILTPILYFITSVTMQYHGIVLCNVIITYFSVLVLRKVLRQFAVKWNHHLLMILSGVGIFYANNLVFMQLSLPESMLVLCYLLTIERLYAYLEQPSLLRLLFIVVTVAYYYVVHMRTIGCVLAIVLVLLLAAILDKRYRIHALLLCVGIGSCFMLFTSYKNAYTERIYAVDTVIEMAGRNDYAGQFANIQYLCSKEGFYYLVNSFVGKICYLGAATFGLFYWGIVWFAKESVFLRIFSKTRMNRSRTVSNQEYVCTYILLATMATIAISSISTAGAGRIDMILYGRYNEMVLPVITSMGLYYMVTSRQLYQKTMILMLLQMGTSIVINLFLATNTFNSFEPHSIIGIIYAFVYSGGNRGDFLTIMVVVSSAIIVSLAVLVRIGVQQKKQYGWLLSVMMLQFVIAAIGSEETIYRWNLDAHSDITLVEELRRNHDGEQKVQFLYADPNAHGYIALLQYSMREITVEVVHETAVEPESLDPSAIVITNIYDVFVERVTEEYDVMEQSARFKVFYNE